MMPGDPVVGSTILRRPAIQSPNFVTTVSGWTINADGSAEFDNLSIRGTFAGTDFVINSSGVFLYSPSEAAGNLVESSAPAAGVDQFNDNYLAGHATYGAGAATAVNAGFVTLYTGSLAGGWTAQATMETDVSGDLLLATSGAGTIQLVSAAAAGSTLTVAGDTQLQSTAEISGTLTVGNGSTSSLVFSPKIATPVNFPTSGKTLAQTQACLDALITSFRNRGMVN
jgi:hypothetical protein